MQENAQNVASTQWLEGEAQRNWLLLLRDDLLLSPLKSKHNSKWILQHIPVASPLPILPLTRKRRRHRCGSFFSPLAQLQASRLIWVNATSLTQFAKRCYAQLHHQLHLHWHRWNDVIPIPHNTVPWNGKLINGDICAYSLVYFAEWARLASS